MPSKPPSKIPRAVSAYLSEIGARGGRRVSPEAARERARKGGLARAEKYGLGQFARDRQQRA
jgi:general stress protein YciG